LPLPGPIPVGTVRVCPRIVGREPLAPAVDDAFARAMPWIERFAGSIGARLEITEESVVEDPRADEDPLVQFALDLRSFVGRQRLTSHALELDPSLAEAIDATSDVTLDDYLALRRRRSGFQRCLDAALEGALIVTPTLTIPGLTAAGAPVLESAHPTGAAGQPIPQSVTNTNLHNWTGHPALSVPAGMLPLTGNPFGLQISGARGSDRLLLDTADSWFRIAPWPPTAPGFSSLVV
jgi:amidase